MPQCVACGREMREGVHVCSSCGTEVNGDAFATRTVAAAPPPRPASSPRDSRPSSSARYQGRFAPGEILGGRYRIIAMLGKGGMGEVYRADDLSLDQQVALKFLPEALTRNAQALERFRNEVRVARQVSHPNVCRVYDLGEMNGLYFLSMEYIDGEDLGSLLRRIGRLPADKAIEIARKLCAGLAAAHEKGVLHRDLKPANVMIDSRGHVFLTDFGLAGLAGEIEGSDIRSGTPAYMAPEQLAAEEVTVRSDIYALGLVLYELFTGKLPFESDTLAGLIRAQRESVPVSPASIVRDLDPGVERIILRCLSAKPAMRPPSALAVAAALPGGDPLAAALAAGETPSPEMVAAAGEGEGLSPRVALPLLALVIAGLFAGLLLRSSALATLAPPFGPEVLAQKAKDIAAKLGAPGRPFDEDYKFEWDNGLFEWFASQPGRRNWREVLTSNPQALRFEYRAHTAPLTGVMLHDDLMTPGVIYWEDPPQTDSGMVRMRLDSSGRLLYFERIPPQLEKPSNLSGAADWNPLFAAAGMDQGSFQPVPPEWTSLAASDTRVAWTRTTPRAQRIEAASLHGQPVFFAVIEPWMKPDRMPGATDSLSGTLTVGVLGGIAIVILVSAALLATANLRRQRGDRRGALRLAIFVFCLQMSLWLSRAHLGLSMGTFGIFLVALATSVFYAVLMWTVYMALEPYVRRRWPQALISWSTVLMGRVRDGIVGRDVLLGCAAGAVFTVVGGLSEYWMRSSGGWPNQDLTVALASGRGFFALVFLTVPHAVRESLLFLLLIFLLRVLLRNEWAAGVVFALLFASTNLYSGSHAIFNTAVTFFVFFAMGFLVLRWGLLALAVCMLFTNVTNLPLGGTSAWYFPGTVLVLAAAIALAAWAFYRSLGGRKLWSADLFG